MTPEQRAALENVVLYYERNGVAEAECLRELLSRERGEEMSEREEFETEMGKDPFFWDRNLCVDENGAYKTTEARAAWYAWQAARRTVSGQEAVLTMQIINGEVFEYEYTGNLMDGEYRLYAAPIPATEPKEPK
jgi:hypothetical protein